MKKIEMMRLLLEDAAEEVKKIERYEKGLSQRDSRVLQEGRPSRQRVKDDLKMIRRLSLEAEREAERL